MRTASSFIVAIGTGVAAIVLVLRLLNMLRGGNPNLLQKLMRWQVGVQSAVIVIILGVSISRVGTCFKSTNLPLSGKRLAP
jgi:ABC-type nickel/cobalt efflux system permease component RcnA